MLPDSFNSGVMVIRPSQRIPPALPPRLSLTHALTLSLSQPPLFLPALSSHIQRLASAYTVSVAALSYGGRNWLRGSFAMLLRLVHSAICLRARCAMSGTDIAYDDPAEPYDGGDQGLLNGFFNGQVHFMRVSCYAYADLYPARVASTRHELIIRRIADTGRTRIVLCVDTRCS
eukprot:3177312-Rhodomonas_salina.5